jgi:hypothetical protein
LHVQPLHQDSLVDWVYDSVQEWVVVVLVDTFGHSVAVPLGPHRLSIPVFLIHSRFGPFTLIERENVIAQAFFHVEQRVQMTDGFFEFIHLLLIIFLAVYGCSLFVHIRPSLCHCLIPSFLDQLVLLLLLAAAKFGERALLFLV